MKRVLYPRFLAVALIAFAVGCANQQSVGDRLIDVDIAVTQSWTLATELRQNGYITDQEWVQLKDGLKQASEKIDQAWGLYKTNPDGAEKSLMGIEAVLGEIKKRLLARQIERVEKST